MNMQQIKQLETNDLYKYMRETNKRAIIYQTKKERYSICQVVVCRAPPIMYGDLIAIVPTFAPLTIMILFLLLSLTKNEKLKAVE